ncbi:MAG: hypothetical protein IJP44_05845 [Bacteroidales bacterium]|nr:hypothetical protein [Bacteroidales bacterium]
MKYLMLEVPQRAASFEDRGTFFMLCRFCAVSGPTRNAKSRHGGIGKELLDNIFELWYKLFKETVMTVKPAPLLGFVAWEHTLFYS